MSQLLLHKIHQENGAHFIDDGLWELPKHYGDPLLEYQAARMTVGLADLSYQGKFIISGEDRISFLQGLISNDLTLASKDLGIYTTLLTAKGRMISDFSLFPISEGLLMEIDWANAEKTKEQLLRFRLRAKVDMSIPPWGKLLVSGSQSKILIDGLLGESLPEMQDYAFIETEVDGARLICIKRSVTGEADFHLYTPLEHLTSLWQRLMVDGQALKIKALGQEALDILRIEAGKPRYGIDFDEDIIPIEAGLQDEAISYTKGCFPGQEVIARIKTYGQVKKQLSGLILEGSELPQKGDKVSYQGKEVGWVTSAVQSPHIGKVIAMAYLRREVIAEGTNVDIMINGLEVKGMHTTLPFYPGQSN